MQRTLIEYAGTRKDNIIIHCRCCQIYTTMPYFNFLWRYKCWGVIFPSCTTPIPGSRNEQLCVHGVGTRCGLTSFVPRQIHQETRRWQAGFSTYWRAARWLWRKSPNFKWPTAVILIRICFHYLYIASR